MVGEEAGEESLSYLSLKERTMHRYGAVQKALNEGTQRFDFRDTFFVGLGRVRSVERELFKVHMEYTSQRVLLGREFWINVRTRRQAMLYLYFVEFMVELRARKEATQVVTERNRIIRENAWRFKKNRETVPWNGWDEEDIARELFKEELRTYYV
jgi:hypothetical protein